METNNNNNNPNNNYAAEPKPEEILNVNDVISDLTSPINIALKKLGIKREDINLNKNTGDTAGNDQITAPTEVKRAAEDNQTDLISELAAPIEKILKKLEENKENNINKKTTGNTLEKENFILNTATSDEGRQQVLIKARDAVENIKTIFFNLQKLFTSNYTNSSIKQISNLKNYEIISNNFEEYRKERRLLGNIILSLGFEKPKPSELITLITGILSNIDKIFNSFIEVILLAEYRKHQQSLTEASGAAEHIKTAFYNIQKLFDSIDRNITLENQIEKAQENVKQPVKEGKQEIVDDVIKINATTQTSMYDDYQIISDNLEVYWKEREVLDNIVLTLKNAAPKSLEVINVISDTIINIDNIFTTAFKTRFLSHYLANGNFTRIDLSCWRLGKKPDEDNYDVHGLMQTLLNVSEEPEKNRLSYCLEEIVLNDLPENLIVPYSFIESYCKWEEVLKSIIVTDNNGNTQKETKNDNDKNKIATILSLRLIIGLFLNYNVYSSIKTIQINAKSTKGDIDLILDKLKNHPTLQIIKLSSPVPLSCLNNLNDILKTNNHKLRKFEYYEFIDDINGESAESKEIKIVDKVNKEQYKLQIFPIQNSELQIRNTLELLLNRNKDYGKEIEELIEKHIIFLKKVLQELNTFTALKSNSEIKFKLERYNRLIIRYKLIKDRTYSKIVSYKELFFFDELIKKDLEVIIKIKIFELKNEKDLNEVEKEFLKQIAEQLQNLIESITKCNHIKENEFERYANIHYRALLEITSLISQLVSRFGWNGGIDIDLLNQQNTLLLKKLQNNILTDKELLILNNKEKFDDFENRLINLCQLIDNLKSKITSLIADVKKINDPLQLCLSTTNLLRFIYDTLKLQSNEHEKVNKNLDETDDENTLDMSILDQIKTLLYNAYKNEIETYIKLSFYKNTGEKSGKYDRQTANTIDLARDGGIFIFTEDTYEYIQIQAIICDFYKRQIYDAFLDQSKGKTLDTEDIQILIRISIIPKDLRLLINEMPDPPVQIYRDKRKQQKTIYSLKDKYKPFLELQTNNNYKIDLNLNGTSIQKSYKNHHDYFYFYTNLIIKIFFEKIILLGNSTLDLTKGNKQYYEILNSRLDAFSDAVSEIPQIDLDFLGLASKRLALFIDARIILESISTCLAATGGTLDDASLTQNMEDIIDEDTPSADVIKILKQLCYFNQAQLSLIYFYVSHYIRKREGLEYLDANIKLFHEMIEKKIFYVSNKPRYYNKNKFNLQLNIIFSTYFIYFNIIISNLEISIYNNQTFLNTLFNKDPTGFYEFKQNFYNCFYEKDILSLCYLVANFVFKRCLTPEKFDNQSKTYHEKFTLLINLSISLSKILPIIYSNSKHYQEIRTFFGYLSLFECIQYLLDKLHIRKENLQHQLNIFLDYSQSVEKSNLKNQDCIKPYYETTNLLQIHNNNSNDTTIRLSKAFKECVTQYSLGIELDNQYFKIYYQYIFNLCLSILRPSMTDEVYDAIFKFFKNSVLHIINTSGVSNSDVHKNFINDIAKSDALKTLFDYLENNTEIKEINSIKNIAANLLNISNVLASHQKPVQSFNSQGFWSNNESNSNNIDINKEDKSIYPQPKKPPTLDTKPTRSILRKQVSFVDDANNTNKTDLVKIKAIKKVPFSKALFITGNTSQLGDWKTAFRMTCIDNDTWIIEIPKNLQNCEFKFLEGDYALGANPSVSALAWEEGPNRKLELDTISFSSGPCTFGRT